ncbi:site-2 protease family protein [Sulfuricurvum sp. RIFCSPLOWO2_12_FULL_43_24]|uniref:site-2 protease family protein n=1 Tax=Sulfuricurvum sp. RIFCSPLOWO2_12_FULL_43_24 TaxID=1802247 RepID=UPI0008BFC2E7|nr:site-2 protease family protein [Sulfuricurvum sp. RIFCSPLOWO2_12_FULL_43_24]OHD80224.1 MAG: peptidase M50 [Sulfuricurvum sp. RIFCSPHIGHO2_02_FULL_43_9]OHD83781.1 MAG: peptidase M50 [Sulfuricurvum sp. RIFCSPHIGHO2_12_FULL_44_8]OHD87422.1 MAG: peptidase M50 [Sulfuricurvum sp. RIFCSPLOWO2_02_43_6]OHD90578.1 MAG: peptidase M50 [Sulfuricurvum sp. RIFCSPLOWO2_12_FULL_43_24]
MSFIEPLEIAAAIFALLIAIIGHEIMHGWVAYKYGDTTAKNQGRLSINPLIHIDPFGSILVPLMTYFIPMLLGAPSGFLFGWAKPVPINTQTVLRNGGYNAAMQVSLAGIAYNLFLATLSSVILVSLAQPTEADSIAYIFGYLFVMKLLLINVVLAVFNLLPIPSFDGAHFLTYLSLKYKIRAIAEFFVKAEPYGMIVIIIILVTPLKIPLVMWPIQAVLNLLLN